MISLIALTVIALCLVIMALSLFPSRAAFILSCLLLIPVMLGIALLIILQFGGTIEL